MPRKNQPEPWEAELRLWARAVAAQSPERRERGQVAEILRRMISDSDFLNGRNELNLDSFVRLTELPSLPATVISLSLKEGRALQRLSVLPLILDKLDLSGCHVLTHLPPLPPLPVGLSVIKLNGCASLTRLPNLPARRRSTVDLSGCSGLTELPRLPSYLLELNLSGCTGLTALPALPRLLTELNLSGCTGLSALPAQMPTNLRVLDLRGCTALGALPAWVNQVRHLIRQNGPGGQAGHNLPPLELWYLRAGKSDAEWAQLSLEWATLRAEAGSAGFESLLRRLAELSGREGGQLVAPQAVVAVIEELLQQDAGSRASIFAASAEAEENCHDRPLTVFNDIQGLACCVPGRGRGDTGLGGRHVSPRITRPGGGAAHAAPMARGTPNQQCRWRRTQCGGGAGIALGAAPAIGR